ncbi:MAG: T9SS type A sorting domain-containing protein [Candidatus Marinimicrobia bacterium]|nr:T9SS type A sorting domain-containing protein [Candidatus Neomarinimicrobiota bacterium]
MLNRNALIKVPVTIMMLLLFIIAPADILGRRNHGHDNNEYSMDVTALMGPEDVELTVTLSSSDPDNYPLPDELEKIKVKIHRKKHSRGHGHGHLIDERNVELMDNQVVFSLTEVPLYATLKVDVKFRVGRQKVKFKKHVEVTLRPDLIVEDVGYPMTVFVDQPFNIHANLQEILGDNSAVADITLFADALTMTTPDVLVSPGMPTTVVFTGLSFSTPQIVSFTIDISEANPGEYDITNNSFSFDIEVIPPQTAGETEYYMEYQNWDNRYAVSSTEICGVLEEMIYSGDRDEFYLEGGSVESTPGGSLDVSFRIYADGVSAYALDIEGMTSYVTLDGIEYYDYSDEATGIFITYARNPGNEAYFEINKYSGIDIYVHRINGVITESTTADSGLHMNAHTSIQTSVLFDDGFSLIGGSASMTLGPPDISDEGFSFGVPNPDPACGEDIISFYISEEYYYAYNEGIMDSTFLPRRNQPTVKAPIVPERIYLANNFPNPFNPTTAISFGLPEDSRVNLLLYDISGREVLKLAEGQFSAGRHELYLDASELSSGTYFYSLEAGSFKEVKRMLLLK